MKLYQLDGNARIFTEDELRSMYNNDVILGKFYSSFENWKVLNRIRFVEETYNELHIRESINNIKQFLSYCTSAEEAGRLTQYLSQINELKKLIDTASLHAKNLLAIQNFN